MGDNKRLEDMLFLKDVIAGDEVEIAGVRIKKSEAKAIGPILKDMKFFNKSNAPKEEEQFDMLTRDYFQVEEGHITAIGKFPGSNPLTYKKLLHNIKKFPKLQKILLSNCSLKLIPEQIYNIPNLKGLYIPNNELHRVYKKIGELKELEALNLAYNELNSIPAAIYTLPKLEWLNISGNHLSTIPNDFNNMKKLRVLYLHENDFKIVPKAISELPSLEELWIDKRLKATKNDANAKLHEEYDNLLNNLMNKGVAVQRK